MLIVSVFFGLQQVVMHTLYGEIEKQNSDLLYAKFTSKLYELHNKHVQIKIKKGEYAVSGGHAGYERDMRLMYDKFSEEFKYIDISEVCLICSYLPSIFTVVIHSFGITHFE